MRGLNGKNVLVTGGSSGIGQAIAVRFAEHGANVAINYLTTPDEAAETEQQVEACIGRIRDHEVRDVLVQGDVSKEEDVIRMVEQTVDELGGIDVLVNNAGIHRRAPLAEMTEAEWREVIDTNLTRAFLVARALAPRMIARQGGKIINICSLMSEAGRPTTGNYAAAKGGLKMLTRAMAVEWAKHNLQINGIGPGYIDTEMTRPLIENPDFDRWVKARTPAGRWGRPEDLVGAVVFLASPASDYVNGQIIYVDGGLLAAV